MSRLIGGGGLLLVAVFMVLGFLGADVDPTAPATLLALLIAAGLPAAGGALLLRSHFAGSGRAARRKEELRRRTLQAEVLKLAERHGGRLTVVEVVAEMALSPEAAKETMDSLMTAGLADIEVTDSGLLVYSFSDIRQLPEKGGARGILED